MKKIYKLTISYKYNTDEYVVNVFKFEPETSIKDENCIIVPGKWKRQEKMCYYTDDKKDAIGTKRLMTKDLSVDHIVTT